MRDYGALAHRVEALAGDGVERRVLADVAGFPVFGVRVVGDASLPAVLVNGGTHGDEPAGVEGALAFLEGVAQGWLGLFQFEVVPCLNPYGYVHKTRSNAQGVDINWAFRREDVPEVGVVRRLIDGRWFEAVVDFHEDWESPGYYLYEMVRNRPPAGPEIVRRVSRVCPLNTSPEIEGEVAVDGVIHPDLEAEKRCRGDGIPVELFKQRYTDHLITSETPTEKPMEARVNAHLAALGTVLEAHRPKGGRPDA